MTSKSRDAADQWRRATAILENLDREISRVLGLVGRALDFADALEARKHVPHLLKVNARRERIARFMAEALSVALPEVGAA